MPALMSDDSLLIRPLSDLFPATSRWIYIDAATSGLLPETARERVAGVLEAQLVASFGENHALSMLQSCREFFARMVHAAAADVSLMPSSAGALHAIAARLAWPRRNNIVLCSALSRPSFAAFWRRHAQRNGLEVREAAFDCGGFQVAQLEKLIDAGTAMVAMPVVSHARGWRLPVAGIGSLCRARNVFFLVDGSASVGIIRTDVVRDGVDGLFVAADGNALGIHGAAFVFVDEVWGGRADPFLQHRIAGDSRPEMPHLLSLAAAQEVLRVCDGCGVAEIEHHAVGLAEQLRRALEELGMPVERPRISGQLGHVAAVGVAETEVDAPLQDPGLRKFAEQLTSGRVRYAVRSGQLQFGFHLYNRLRDVMDVRRIAAQSLAA
ncbi:MAG: aminotransferase class V-fold PLP-dependent enzyme [Burkholderiales bacterium]|nr:aminotransferase class V-fold PLP-dependent enzyme [Burkholderiales bacterium]